MRKPACWSTAILALAAACAPASQDSTSVEPARYLFSWAYDADERDGDTNFLAVIDVDPRSPSYATVVATMPTGTVGGMPHHTEPAAPRSGWPFFANAFHAGRSFLVDLSNPLAPRLAGEAQAVPGYHMPHSFYRLSDGRVLATMQYGDDAEPGRPGGLALFASDGAVLRTNSSRDSAFAGAPIRTYSGDVSEAADRIITTSSPMDEERTADVLQIWRLSDLTLLHTLAVPQAPGDTMGWYPFEIRLLNGGTEALMNTYYCAFFHVTGVTGAEPRIERVLALDFPRSTACGVPVVIGKWWIMPVEAAHEILVLDVSNPRAPRIVHTLATDSTFRPHWSAWDPGSDRVVFPSEASGDARLLIARLDRATGRLSWDDSFREPGSSRLGVSFGRETWPHGATGPAAPHGTVFANTGRSRP